MHRFWCISWANIESMLSIGARIGALQPGQSRYLAIPESTELLTQKTVCFFLVPRGLQLRGCPHLYERALANTPCQLTKSVYRLLQLFPQGPRGSRLHQGDRAKVPIGHLNAALGALGSRVTCTVRPRVHCLCRPLRIQLST